MRKTWTRLGMLCLVATTAAAAPSVLWETRIDGYGDKPTVADLNGDHRLEVLVATDRGHMIALSGGNGNILWSLSTNEVEKFIAVPVVGDPDLDGRAEVLFIGSRYGSVYCLNGEDGSILWERPGLGHGVIGSAALATLTAGQGPSLTYVEKDTMLCLDGRTGELRWQWAVPGGSAGSVATVDLDGLPGLELLVGNNAGQLLCLDATPNGPTVRWQAEVRGRVTKPPLVVDADRNGRPEIYIPGDTGIARIETDGSVTWRWKPKAKGVSSSAACYDVNGDGTPEIVASCSDGSLYAVSHAGKTVWSYPIVTDTMFIPASTPAIADFTDDRAGDVIVCSPQSNDAKVHAVNGKTGKRLWTWPMPWFSQSCPAIADMDSDGMIEVVYGVPQGKGLLVCLKLGARAAGGWLKFGGSLANTGFWPVAVEDSASLVVGRSPFEVAEVAVDWADKLDPAPVRLPGGPVGGAGRPVGNVAVSLNGNWLLLDPPARMSGNSVLVPLRGIFEAMRSEVKYEPATKVITATRGTTEVVLKLGSKAATVSGRSVALAAAAESVNGSTFVPLRFIGEAFGAEVKWDGAERNVLITDPSLVTETDG